MTRASDSSLRQPLCCRVKLWASCFTLLRCSSLSCLNEYLAVDRGGYLCMKPAQYLQRDWMLPERLRRCFIEQVCQGVKCKSLSNLEDWILCYIRKHLYLILALDCQLREPGLLLFQTSCRFIHSTLHQFTQLYE